MILSTDEVRKSVSILDLEKFRVDSRSELQTSDILRPVFSPVIFGATVLSVTKHEEDA